ncbi:MAG TPA: hypothetical protein VNZ45_13595 [Bacteroidia bacterium]|nr:hypothetical protein [Bacteroidia bacterium]
MRTLQKNKFKSPYVATDGKALPGVTTILGLLNKPALLPWAWSQGKKGIPLNKAKDNAIDIGNIAHYLIECFVTNEEPVLDELYNPEHVLLAHQMLYLFKDYWTLRQATLVASELPLIDEVVGYGGTIDLIVKCEDKGTTEIWDIKTAKDIWPEYWMQLAAYLQLADNTEECNHCDAVDVCRILLITKELTFSAPSKSDEYMEDALNAFLHLAAAYPYVMKVRK